MMEVRDVGMVVDDPRVPVDVGVLAVRGCLVDVVVVPVVVTVGVLVDDRLVEVRVPVALGEVEDEADHHRAGRDDGEHAPWLAQRPREHGAPERT